MSEEKKNQQDTSEETVVKESAGKKEAKAKKKDKPSLMSRVKSWLRTYKSDMKKIVWSSPKQVLHNSILVLVSVIVIGAVIGILDLVFNMSIVGLDSIFG